MFQNMIFQTLILPLTILFVAILTALVYQERHVTNTELIAEFSANLRNWHGKGEYFIYKKEKKKVFVLKYKFIFKTRF